MKFSSTFVVVSALACSAPLVSAAPLVARDSNKTELVMNSKSGSGAAGAAYFITNEPDGNFVVSADIGQDGKLTLARAVATDGRGQHGNDGKNGPDPLFSQGAVKASAASKLVAAVNPGSNTVSLFKIDPNTPSQLTKFGAPVSSEGEFPMSLAFNKDGTHLCTLNGGAVNGVACFNVDQKLGLVPMNNTVRSLNLQEQTPPQGPAGTTSHLIFSEDNNQLIASVKGTPPTPGFLAVWDVASDGSLSQDFKQVPVANGGLLPFGMSVIPGKNALFVADAGVGVDVADFSNINTGNQKRFSTDNGDSQIFDFHPANNMAITKNNMPMNSKGNNANTSNGSQNINIGKSAVLKVDNQSAVCWTAFSKQSGNFYVSDIGTNLLTEVNVDNNLTPKIVKQYQEKGSTTDMDVATVQKKDFLYVLEPGAQSVQVLSVNAPGQAKNLQTLDIAGPAKKAGLTTNAANLQGMAVFVKA